MLNIYSTYNCVTLTRILSTAKPVFLVVMRYKTIVISCLGFSGPTCDQPNSSQMMTTQVTYPDPCIASASVCNEPAKCKAVGPQDFICVCPETDKTRNDNCLIPHYYEKYGFCCAKNTCKGDAIVC
jgi:hypothetical protein